MSLLEKRKTGSSIVGIWKLEERMEELQGKIKLSDTDKEKFSELKNEYRKKQWLAARLLLNEVLQKEAEIIYDEFNKPFVKDGSVKISLSHSNYLVALIADTHNECGIDIELVKPSIQNIAKKFLAETELQNIKSGIDQMYVYWCAKEAMYKIYGRKELSFKENLPVNPFSYEDRGTITGRIITGSVNKECKLWYEKRGEYMLLYSIHG